MQEIAFSMVFVDLRALHPLIHRMELFSSVKLTFVRMNDITSEYFSSLLSEIFWATRFMTFLAEGPAPPVDESTRGLKVLFSTSLIVVYRKANNTSRAGHTQLRRINPNQTNNIHLTPGIFE